MEAQIKSGWRREENKFLFFSLDVFSFFYCEFFYDEEIPLDTSRSDFFSLTVVVPVGKIPKAVCFPFWEVRERKGEKKLIQLCDPDCQSARLKSGFIVLMIKIWGDDRKGAAFDCTTT